MEHPDKRSALIASAATYEIQFQQLEETILCQARTNERIIMAKLQESKTAAAA